MAEGSSHRLVAGEFSTVSRPSEAANFLMLRGRERELHAEGTVIGLPSGAHHT